MSFIKRSLKQNKYRLSFFCIFGILINTGTTNAMPLTILETVYKGESWQFELPHDGDALNTIEETYINIKNTSIKLPVILEDNDIGPELESALNIIKTSVIIVNPVTIDNYLQTKIIKKIEKPVSNTNIFYDKNNNIIINGKTENGFSIDKKRFIENVNFALNSNMARIVIPVIENQAKVIVSDDLQKLGIKELVATGHSAFAGSPKKRVHNISTGIKRYNGLLVRPGETFSFNKHLGPVDKEHDFLEELVIKPEGTIPEYGGGLCQLSSTLYRAALYGGFPIVERAPHSYAVSYYAQIGGYGLDATVYPGARDVRFLNDSPAHLLIQAYTDGDHAYYKFYGTSDNRKTRLEGPLINNRSSPGPTQIVETNKLPSGIKKQVEKQHSGFDVTWYRYVMKGGTEKKETVFSRYKSIPEKILVGKTQM